jgi:hypothetical protein
LLDNIAEASCQAIGLSRKKKSPVGENMSEKGEKEKGGQKHATDDYYDDRLSRDSQLDDNLKSLVSSRPASATFGHLSTDLDTVSGEEDDTHIVDEFYEEVSCRDADKQSSDKLQSDSYTTADNLTTEEMGAMMGDWKEGDISIPDQGNKRHASSSPGQAVSDTSILSVDMPVRHDPKRIAMADRQLIKIVKMTGTEAGMDGIQEQLAEIPALKQQLSAALQEIGNLKMAMNEQFDALSRTATAVSSHGVAIDNIQEQADIFRQKLVSVEVQSDSACADMEAAKLLARRSEATANKSMEIAQACKEEMKAMQGRMAALRKIQDDMVINVSKLQDRPGQEQGASLPRSDEMSENSIFLAGIPAIRDRLRLPRTADPVYVVSCFLRELEIYTGMDSIVIADNAAQTRTAARAVIIHMRSNFHKRGAMSILRRELARQKMAETAVRDCFPTASMETVKRYIRFAMKLKTSGVVDKFQIINRKGQPVLQTGMRNGNYADYQGVVEEEDQPEESRQEDGPWTTVGKKGKNRPTIKEAAPAGQQQGEDRQAAQSGGASALPTRWARLTEEDFPELPTGDKQNNPGKQIDRHPRKNSSSQADNSNSNNQQKSKPISNSINRNTASHSSSNKPNSKSSSRGTSRNSSRQTSRERGDSRGDKINYSSRQESRRSPPPPFRSYFSERVLNTSEEPRLARRKDTSDSSRQAVHEQYHRKR